MGPAIDAAASSTVIATQKGAATVLVETKSIVATSFSGRGFVHLVR